MDIDSKLDETFLKGLTIIIYPKKPGSAVAQKQI